MGGILPSYFKAAALGYAPVSASTACIPIRIFREVGEFPIGKRKGEDLDMWGRVALRYPVAFSRQTEASYYFDPFDTDNISFNENDEHPFIKTIVNGIEHGSISASYYQT